MTPPEFDAAVKAAYFFTTPALALAFTAAGVYAGRRARRGGGPRRAFRPGPFEPRSGVRRHRSPVERPLLTPLRIAAAEAPGAVVRGTVRRSVAVVRWCRRWARTVRWGAGRELAAAAAGARRTVVVLQEVATPPTYCGRSTWLVGAA